jgi:hypothetical protein
LIRLSVNPSRILFAARDSIPEFLLKCNRI